MLLKEISNPWHTSLDLEPGTRSFEFGETSIIVSPPFQGEGWHLLFSRPQRAPFKSEIDEALKALTVSKIIPADLIWTSQNGSWNRCVIHFRSIWHGHDHH